MDGWMDGWMGGWVGGWVDGWWMDGWMDGWIMDGWIHGWVDGWMDGWMDGAEPCVCVCLCVCVFVCVCRIREFHVSAYIHLCIHATRRELPDQTHGLIHTDREVLRGPPSDKKICEARSSTVNPSPWLRIPKTLTPLNPVGLHAAS